MNSEVDGTDEILSFARYLDLLVYLFTSFSYFFVCLFSFSSVNTFVNCSVVLDHLFMSVLDNLLKVLTSGNPLILTLQKCEMYHCVLPVSFSLKTNQSPAGHQQ